MYIAQVKVVSDKSPDGEWLIITYNKDVLEKLHHSTSWIQTVELFKPLVSKNDSIIQINLKCTMELKEEFQLLKMGQ